VKQVKLGADGNHSGESLLGQRFNPARLLKPSEHAGRPIPRGCQRTAHGLMDGGKAQLMAARSCLRAAGCSGEGCSTRAAKIANQESSIRNPALSFPAGVGLNERWRAEVRRGRQPGGDKPVWSPALRSPPPPCLEREARSGAPFSRTAYNLSFHKPSRASRSRRGSFSVPDLHCGRRASSSLPAAGKERRF
jgi:hypothetical protein